MKSFTRIHANVRYEWIALTLALLLLASLLGFHNGLGRFDLVMYDQAIQLNEKKIRDDIIIIAIDDYSIAELGKWPWPRERHAQLFQKINQAGPAVIGFDVLFNEAENNPDPSNVHGDDDLAAAIAGNHVTVLPIALENSGQGLAVTRPLPALVQAARGLAQINLEVDPDGFARSVFLIEGRSDQWWPHLSLAMYNIIQQRAPNDISGIRNNTLPIRTGTGTTAEAGLAGLAWMREAQFHIPFYGNQGSFKSVPYVSVLRGEVPMPFFAGKKILIGATAVGMADSYPTPASGADGAMPGIEINANILASLLDGRSIVLASAWQTLLFSSMPVLLVLIAYLWLSPRMALACTVLLVLATLALSYRALTMGIWLPPGAALICLVISYPLWSWRRLEAAIRYLNKEFIRLNNEPSILPELHDEVIKPRLFGDTLAHRISAMEQAAQRVRDLRQFVTDSLQSLPDATLVTTIEGQVILSNQPADGYFASLGIKTIKDTLLPYLFANMLHPHPVEQTSVATFSWWHLLDLQQVELMKSGVEVGDTLGRHLIIKSAPCRNSAQQHTGWIVSISDISTIRRAERARDESLRFISHDMRAPQASILALLELQLDPECALPQEEFLARIAKAANVTLELADNFIQLARAEGQNYQLDVIDAQDLLIEACDDMWGLAKAKHIQIISKLPDTENLVHVSRSLMTRVLTNLISNAIKYSPENTSITIELERKSEFLNDQVIIRVIDHGYGIAWVDQAKLFQRFQRFLTLNQPRSEGVGLGLVFVKSVLDRHGAQISFVSKPNEGSTFSISIPVHYES